MIRSVVEAGTGVCETVEQARERVAGVRADVGSVLAEAGLRVACSGTHPFSRWNEQLITEKDRYEMLEDEMQDVVASIPIFGLHVHVAIPAWAPGIEVMNESRYFLPHLLALSTSSPFWAGRDTGLKSYRSVIWSSFPRTGIPPDFVSRDEYDNYLEMLVKTGCVHDGKRIWWDVRSNPQFPTLEFRCCDQTTRLDETICMAALIQAICTKLLELRERNLGFRKYMPALIAENRWRAMRYGIDGKLIDFGKQAEVPMRDLAMELLAFIDDVVDDLGSRKAVEHVNTILRDGTSADRQLNAHREHGSLRAVVNRVCEETVAGFP
jgi:carboxylate-amine ligase